jgi:hypothetical protein
VTQARQRVKPARSIRLVIPFDPSNPSGMAAVRITVGKEAADYSLVRIPSDFGTAFEVGKVFGGGAEPYRVCLDGEHSTCDCKGHLKHGHCKHVAGLLALQRRGLL